MTIAAPKSSEIISKIFNILHKDLKFEKSFSLYYLDAYQGQIPYLEKTYNTKHIEWLGNKTITEKIMFHSYPDGQSAVSQTIFDEDLNEIDSIYYKDAQKFLSQRKALKLVFKGYKVEPATVWKISSERDCERDIKLDVKISKLKEKKVLKLSDLE